MRWPKQSVTDRFVSKVIEVDSCLMWTGSRLNSGYGSFYLNGGRPAHRVAYELFVGPIPAGLEIDHLCRNRLCVNPDHLEPVTRRTNQLRAFGEDQCRAGHPRIPTNVYIAPSGKRGCAPCRKAARRRWEEQRRSAA